MPLLKYPMLLGWEPFGTQGFGLASAPTTVISASSYQVGFEPANLGTERLAGAGQQWRSAYGALTGVHVTIDLGSTMLVRGAALIGSNLQPGVATRRVLYSTHADLSSPVGDSGTGTAIDVSASGAAARTPPWGEHVVHVLASEVSARYVDFALTDASNPDNFLRASVAIVGRGFQAGRGVPVGSERGVAFTGSEVYKIPLRSWTFEWTLDDQEKADLESILVAAGGVHRMLFLLNPADPASFRQEAIWCSHPTDLKRVPAQKKKWWTKSVSFVEVAE